MKRFVVVGHRGAGAERLSRLVAGHPELVLCGELFHPRWEDRAAWPAADGAGSVRYDNPQEDAFAFLDRTLWAGSTDHLAVGFMLLTDRLDVPGTARFYARLRQHAPDLRVVHVERANLLEVFLASQPADAPLEVDPQALEALFRGRAAMSDFFTRHFGDHGFLSVSHDRLMVDPQAELDRLLHFLGVSGYKPSAQQVQAALSPMRSAVIQNHAALKQAFRDTPFSGFFDTEIQEEAPRDAPVRHPIQILSANEYAIADLHFVDPGHDRNAQTTLDRVVILKPARMLQAYVDRFAHEGIRNVLEFGIWQGGSPLALTHLLGLRKFVGIEILPPVEPLDQIISRHGLDQRISIHYETSQSDEPAVRDIIEKHFRGRSLDLVIDDASHEYPHALRSFEIAFPYLKPGGHYVIEDWGWSHWPGFAHYASGLADQPSMSSLVFELVMACASSSHVIESVSVQPAYVVVRKASTCTAARREAFSLSALIQIHHRQFKPL